jgi:hypothetical protein
VTEDTKEEYEPEYIRRFRIFTRAAYLSAAESAYGAYQQGSVAIVVPWEDLADRDKAKWLAVVEHTLNWLEPMLLSIPKVEGDPGELKVVWAAGQPAPAVLMSAEMLEQVVQVLNKFFQLTKDV